ncbi:MAG TPA: hypothetical protein VIV11_16260, partial [Kofleriaceae bacterium]
DSRSPAERAASRELRDQVPTHAKSKHGALAAASKHERFADVVKLEQTKQALIQLGYKARAARRALEEACAHVGTDADIPTIVKAVLDADRNGGANRANSGSDEPEQLIKEAIQALVRLGYPKNAAVAAVRGATEQVDGAADLPALIKEALRLCA